ncbi:MAG: TIGR03617 family F420-dependent LLM class oxidoreductase [Candidatus Binatia bacterium]|nr:TIGR03617 family F420-dependent LLM class oxidoreductase [Candidatus Binatia bacterium]
MLIYANTNQRIPLADIAEHARRAERIGYDGLNVPEAVHDGLLASSLALQATTTLRVATSVLVAFTRSPMTTAVAAWDLQAYSKGRFELGLGAQVRGNVEDRYGAAWSPPVARMREFVGAIRATFACWQNGEKLAFEGEHYKLTRMQPFFAPEPLDVGPVPIFLGAVGPRMTTLAGEVADGLVTHPTNTHPRYLREVIQPRLAKGATRGQRGDAKVSLKVGPICSVGRDQAAIDAQREEKRRSLAFLYSTPQYWPSLDLFGWGDRGKALHQLTRENRWKDLPEVLDDEMLDTFLLAGTYDELPGILRSTYEALAEAIVFPMPEDPADDNLAARAIAVLRG